MTCTYVRVASWPTTDTRFLRCAVVFLKITCSRLMRCVVVVITTSVARRMRCDVVVVRAATVARRFDVDVVACRRFLT